MRFHVHDQPPALPGCCYICRSVSNGPFVDTAVNEAGIGAIYICATCLKEMYQLVKPEETLFNSTQVQEVRDRVAQLADDEFKKVFSRVGDSLNDARTRVELGTRAIFPDALVVDFSDSDGSEGSETSDTGDDANVEGNDLGLDEIDVQGGDLADGEGSDFVPGNSSDGTGAGELNFDGDDSETDER